MENIFLGENKWNYVNWERISPSDSHTVLYHLPIVEDVDTPPKPQRGRDKWDTEHVRLPSSIKNQYPVTKANGTTELATRWEMIQDALLKPIYTSRELEAAILSYNSKYIDQWKFTALHKLFEEELEEEESFAFFETSLPKIVALALQLPDLIPNAVPLLKHDKNHSISMTQQQVACLLANAFLCTFPRRNTRKKNSEYSSFPDINLNRLFGAPENQRVLEKLKCLCNYFRRVCNSPPTGVVTFARRSLQENEIPNWETCTKTFETTPIHVVVDGTIEKNGLGMLQVDFANKFLGGGVLRSGCVQEEIRFVICPELLITRLFVEFMKPNEAVFIIGCEQFNKYEGYASDFMWAGNYEDKTPRDTSRRMKTTVVAIDALKFYQTDHQLREDLLLRELKKAYVGFLYTPNTRAPPVATGNWGCGAFKGSTQLKSLLQLMVCVVTGRPLVYFTFGDTELCDGIYNVYEYLCINKVRVLDLWRFIKMYKKSGKSLDQLFQCVYNILPVAKSPKTKTIIISDPSTITDVVEVNLGKRTNVESIPSTSTSSVVRKPFQSFFKKTLSLDKTVKSCTGTTSDTVSRKSLLDSLDDYYDSGNSSAKKSANNKIFDIREDSMDHDGHDLEHSNTTTKMIGDATPPVDLEVDDEEEIPCTPDQKTRTFTTGRTSITNAGSDGKSTIKQKNIRDFFIKK